MQQAMLDIMSTDAYGLTLDTFSEGAQKKIEALAQKMAEDYNLVAINHNDLARGCECTDRECMDYHIQSLIKENSSDQQIFSSVTSSYTPHGVYYILEEVASRMNKS